MPDEKIIRLFLYTRKCSPLQECCPTSPTEQRMMLGCTIAAGKKMVSSLLVGSTRITHLETMKMKQFPLRMCLSQLRRGTAATVHQEELRRDGQDQHECCHKVVPGSYILKLVPQEDFKCFLRSIKAILICKKCSSRF